MLHVSSKENGTHFWHTICTRKSATAHIKFFDLSMWRLFEGSTYSGAVLMGHQRKTEEVPEAAIPLP